jgi:transposase
MTVEEQLISALAEVERLRKAVVGKDAEISHKDALLSLKDAEISQKNAEIKKLSDTLLWLRRKVFGKMSEKNLPLDPDQLLLFEQEHLTDEERARLDKEVEAAEQQMTKTITVKVKPSRRDLDTTGLPTEVIDIYPDGTTDENGKLKDEYVEIGTDESSRLEHIAAKTYIKKTVIHKVMLKSDSNNKTPEDRRIICARLPLAPVNRCMAGASVLTDIIIGKFMYHLPFYRQIQQYKESGITISDSTMGGWYEAAVEKLKLLYDILRQHILQSEYIQIDESVLPVIDSEKHKARKGYEWCVRDAIRGAVMFYYDRGSRGGKVAREILGAYKGAVQCDGYDAYDQFEKNDNITVYGCWAHARRKFVDALNENNRLATEALCFIRKIYKVESDADKAGLNADELKEQRLKISYPTIRLFETWMKETYLKVLPNSKMGDAIEYTYSLLPRLSRYVNDGRINIDNNLIENTIRPLALGRKNYLFCGNDASAYRAAIVYSLISTCKAADVDPRTWMEDVLRKIPYYQRDQRDLAELLPFNWKNRYE